MSLVDSETRYPSRQRVLSVISPIIDGSGVCPELLFGGGMVRRHDVVAARHACILEVKQAFPRATVSHLARVFNVHHATINFVLGDRVKSEALSASIQEFLSSQEQAA